MIEKPPCFTKKVEYQGKQVVLSARDAETLLDIVEFVKNKEDDDIQAALLANSRTVQNGLSKNIKPKWMFWKWHWNRMFTMKYIQAHLSAPELHWYVREIYNLEGLDISTNGKKKENPQDRISVGTMHGH